MQEFLNGGALSIDRLIEERARRSRREHADGGESTPIEERARRSRREHIDRETTIEEGFS